MRPNKGSHSVYSIHLHLVLVTKYRRKVITSAMIARMTEVFQNICKKKKSLMLQFDGESDHVHLLIDLHPDNNISQLVASLKSASSRIIRKEFETEVSKTYSKPVFWSGSYYVASCGGVTIERLRKYIDEQDTPLD
ncbi:transposase IS200-family protein (plasmid) [Stanieria cyanosphaera PCC 7437]|uniref:Transposase IS200-family protein n=1 Tax=Stanieria cyanosphaera (strain ATCC 29371 / PCC 7437) TaxID=111780 RepID=K9Y122_STAC7|nr:IS200/IS605 family transposase [Stanieria cyanosphaera]AFZ38019.1 transposase IS200-family protein [Stanieria cyanosphaera PCC 7437]